MVVFISHSCCYVYMYVSIHVMIYEHVPEDAIRSIVSIQCGLLVLNIVDNRLLLLYTYMYIPNHARYRNSECSLHVHAAIQDHVRRELPET